MTQLVSISRNFFLAGYLCIIWDSAAGVSDADMAFDGSVER